MSRVKTFFPVVPFYIIETKAVKKLSTDDELVEQALSGIEAAMEVLTRRHYAEVFTYVCRRVGDYQDALDLTQETFLRMLRALPAYRDAGNFRGWLFTIAVNVCRDHFRQKRPEAMPENEAEGLPDVRDLYGRSELQSEVRAALAVLPDAQTEAVLLRFYHGYKLREIARITGAREATVKSRLHQAIAKLEILLSGRDEHAKSE